MSEENLSNRYVRMLMDAVEQRGVSRARLCAAANREPRQFDAVEGRVPSAEFYGLCELAIDLTGDPALGLHVVHLARPDSADLVGQLVAHASDSGVALSALLRFQRLGSDMPRLQLIDSEDHVTLRFERPAGLSDRALRFAAEFHMTGIQRLFRYFVRNACPLEVRFEYAAPAYRSEYDTAFGAPVLFEQSATGIVYERGLIGAPRRYRDDEYHRTLCELAARRVSKLERPASCAEEVREVIAKHGARGKIAMDAVARELGVSSRSLRRRLSAEGTSFDAVLNDALARRAMHLLTAQRMTIQETAYALGYSTPTSFHRAFKRWTGKTPSTWQADESPA